MSFNYCHCGKRATTSAGTCGAWECAQYAPTPIIAALQAELAEAREDLAVIDAWLGERGGDDPVTRLEALQTLEDYWVDGARNNRDLREAAETALADKTAALNTAEAEAFELRQLADGTTQAYAKDSLGQSPLEKLGWFSGRARADGFHAQADWLDEFRGDLARAYTAYLERGERE